MGVDSAFLLPEGGFMSFNFRGGTVVCAPTFFRVRESNSDSVVIQGAQISGQGNGENSTAVHPYGFFLGQP